MESLTEVLLRDFESYRHSGGGVTLSGGECIIFPEYLETLLQSLKAKGVHIVMETSGYFNYRSFRQKIYPYLDLIYYDIKLADNAAHKRYCGRPNEIILRNFEGWSGRKEQRSSPAFPYYRESPRPSRIFPRSPVSCTHAELERSGFSRKSHGVGQM